MKLRSFRLRIALLFAMLAGSTVASFGGISWWLIYDAKVSRLNAKLEAVLSHPHPPIKDIGEFYQTSLPSELGTDGDTPIALLVMGRDNNKLYQSERWSNAERKKGFYKSPGKSLLFVYRILRK